MNLNRTARAFALVAFVAATADTVVAQSAQRLTPATTATVLDSVIARVTAIYVDADTARLIANHLRAQQSKRAYDAITNPAQLGEAVTRDLRAINNDLHLGLRFAPAPAPGRAASPGGDPRTLNFGMGRAEILEGNVGYLEITGFTGGSYQDAVVDALRLLSRTDALIIDVRRNGGGASDMSHFIFSHFLGATPVPTIDVRTRRSPEPQHRMSLAQVPGPRRTDVPLYILTSEGTASAAEEFTFVLHNKKRATTVGTRTAGAGHMVSAQPIGNGFTVSLSITRVSDPATGREWESVGVPADIAAPPERALDVAHAAALKRIMQSGEITETRASLLKRLLETVEARGNATAAPALALDRYAGYYEGRSVTMRDGRLWYARRVGALPELLVPVASNTFALGATRLRFAESGDAMTLTVEQPDGTSVVFTRGKAPGGF